MTYFKEGTNIKLDEDELLELTLARLGRIAKKGVHQGRYVFYEHEVKAVLEELLKEAREIPSVNNTHPFVVGTNKVNLNGESNYELARQLDKGKNS
jgi:hypothetical protein